VPASSRAPTDWLCSEAKIQRLPVILYSGYQVGSMFRPKVSSVSRSVPTTGSAQALPDRRRTRRTALM
jgi:hypothetical protein